MQFQQALIHAMEYQGITQAELAARSDTNPRWILHITTKTDWVPKLDTVLRLCYALRFDVLSFLEYAEVGSRGNEFPVPSSQGLRQQSNKGCCLTSSPCTLQRR